MPKWRRASDVSDIKGTPQGDPDGGHYICGNLRNWHKKHTLKDGAVLVIEEVEASKKYKLSVKS